ncbi:hypothetical protein ACFQRL_14285 [Microbacterium fluvii]|uniref:Uncharacterized protein n=1 Tax=Microbacterium fluvii TaxID=415215 RepID=A0ABW2HG59_9MICO|nr:hypothetical protein [Microbacterium fluvii]MCU4673759.1 hypothetical protein [Microbacterium fluvii]
MPVLSNDAVKVTPVTCRTDMTLKEIRDALASRPPKRADYVGGWASTNNNASNMGLVNATPPASEPELVPDGDYPEMIRARYYYWTAMPSAVSTIATTANDDFRVLHGMDVVITQAGSGRVSILVSSRSSVLIRRRDGAIRSLERLFRERDDTIRADFSTSALALDSDDIFLWLAHKVSTQPQIDHQIRLDVLTGISNTDSAQRTADLRLGVDFERPNFLTAVAELDTLGPIELSFRNETAAGKSTFKLKLHLDGGFEIHKSGISYPYFSSSEELMLDASYELAFDLIPRINRIYGDDTAWPERRTQVIMDAMDALQTRYAKQLGDLRARLEAPTP